MTITKKKVMMVTVVPILLMCSLDLLTTYFGVCVFGGAEFNLNAILIIQRFGFIPGGLAWLSVQLIIGLLLAWFLWNSRKNEVSRTFMIVIIVLFLTDLANTVVLNVNTLLYQNIGRGFAPKDEQIKDVTPGQVEEILDTFARDRFCKLIV